VNNYNIPIENIFYLDKELPEYRNIVNYDDLNKIFKKFLNKINLKEKIIIAIDEVQDIEEWERFVN
jgi:predicted AAA+ superfamily ATPase